MRKLFKGILILIGALLGLLVVLLLVILGLRWYNANQYPLMSQAPDVSAQSGYATSSRVQRIEGEYLNGFHFVPTTRTHTGTVIVHGGSEGSPAYEQAKMIADEGYEVLALYFWGQPNQVPTLANVPLEQFDEVTAYIESTISDPTPVTVIGTSKGAEYTALLAAYGFPVDNLVNFAPGSLSYQGLDFSSRDGLPSFVNNGQPIPYASFAAASPGTGLSLMWDMITGRPPAFRAIYEEAAAASDGSARIDLSAFTGEALFFAGGQDAMWQSEVAARELADQSERFEAIIYPDAGHFFHPDIESLGNGWQIMIGGSAEGAKNAFEDSNRILFERLSRWHPALQSHQ